MSFAPLYTSCTFYWIKCSLFTLKTFSGVFDFVFHNGLRHFRRFNVFFARCHSGIYIIFNIFNIFIFLVQFNPKFKTQKLKPKKFKSKI